MVMSTSFVSKATERVLIIQDRLFLTLTTDTSKIKAVLHQVIGTHIVSKAILFSCLSEHKQGTQESIYAAKPS